MTTRQKFEQMLYERGLFESHCTQIMDKVVGADKKEGSHTTFDRPASEYPDALFAAYFLTKVCPAAVEWIETNVPQHWAKAMFLPSNQR